MIPNEDLRLASQLLATADQLRKPRKRASELFASNHPAVAGHPDTSPILVESLAVIQCMEAIAGRLGKPEE